MTLEQQIALAITNGLEHLFSVKLPAADIALQPTRKEFEGQYTLVCFPLTRYSKKGPEETARLLGEHLTSHTELVEKCNVVKGFLNLSISHKAWLEGFMELSSDENFGQLPGNDQRVVVEFSSPNTNKPLHLGHLRNIFLGDSIANILKAAGATVHRLNLVNDRGIHICKSMLAYQKFGQGETPQTAGIKGDHLIGKYYVRFDQEYKKEIEAQVAEGKGKEEAAKEAPLMKEAQHMLLLWERGDDATVALWKKMNGWVYEGFEATYKRMGVAFDKTYYESDTYLLGKDIVKEGLEKGIFFTKEDGSVWIDLRDEGLDEKLVLRGDGTSVYITQDLGTADLKYNDFQYHKSIYVVGNEQDYHFQVLFKTLKKLGRPYGDGLYHLSYGMVDLPSGKMKSREGTVVDADDLMDEMDATAKRHTEDLGKIEGFDQVQAAVLYETLALGALKFYLLKVDPKKRMLFNPEESIEFHGYTGPFVQYTHARISAILRKASEQSIPVQNHVAPPERLHETELAVIQQLLNYPKVLQDAADAQAPSLIAQFVFELAKEYNRFYSEVSIFGAEDESKKLFRVILSAHVAETIRKAMQLLGIAVPERM